MKHILSIIFLLASSAYGQPRGVLMKGFIISYKDDVVFSASTSKDSIIGALNEKAFWVGTMQSRNDDLFRALKNVGDSLTVGVLNDGNPTDSLTMHYFYCEIGFDFSINDSTDFQILDYPNYIFNVGKKTVGFCSIWLRNRVTYLKPENNIYFIKIKNYYLIRNYIVPHFIK